MVILQKQLDKFAEPVEVTKENMKSVFTELEKSGCQLYLDGVVAPYKGLTYKKLLNAQTVKVFNFINGG